MKHHLAIFSEEAVKAIFQGVKKVESRFSQKRIAPFGNVESGDIVYIKPPGKDIVGQFRVKKVISFEGIGKDEWDLIKSKYGSIISVGVKKLDGEYLKKHSSAKYGTLIFFDTLEQFITSPVKLNKKDLRGWVVLN